jgi:hypothetical protein
MIVGRVCSATLWVTCLALMPLAPAVAQTETPAPQDGKASSAASETTHEIELKGEDDLYLLKDLPEQTPEPEPKLDLGKVGKKGKLSLERMPLENDGAYDTKRRGAGGVRLKIPLGKQAP